MDILSSLLGKKENSGLVRLMERLAAGATPELEQAFYSALPGASLRLPAPALESQGFTFGPQVSAGGGSFRFLAATDPEGRDAAMAFTCNDTLLAWRAVGCDTVEMKFPELCALVLSAGLRSLLLDPGSPHCARLGEAELVEFSQGRVPVPAGVCRPENISGTDMVFEKLPQPAPEVLLAALREAAAASAGVSKVYLVSARLGGGAPRPLIALELDEGTDPEKAVSAFASGAVTRLGGRPIPDILPLTDSGPGHRARECGQLVWDKGRV